MLDNRPKNRADGKHPSALKICVRGNKENRLRLHYLDKTEHFVRTFIGITLVCIGHIMLWLKILAPKLVDLKAALVNVEMNIAFFEIWSAGFPYFGLGMQSLDRLPRAVADAFAMHFGKNKENI